MRLSAPNLQISECRLGTLRTVSMATARFHMSPKRPVPIGVLNSEMAPYCCSRLYRNTGMETPNVEPWKVTRLWLPILRIHQVCLCPTRGWILKRSDCWQSRFWKLFALSVLKLQPGNSRWAASKNISITNPHCHNLSNLPVPITMLKSDKFQMLTIKILTSAVGNPALINGVKVCWSRPWNIGVEFIWGTY